MSANRNVRIGLGLLLAALVAAPVVVKQMTTRQAAAATANAKEDALRSHGRPLKQGVARVWVRFSRSALPAAPPVRAGRP